MMDCPACDNCQFDGRDIPSDLHEIHVTVETDDVERFEEVCRYYDIKPIVIAFDHIEDATEQRHVMTSQPFHGDANEAKHFATLMVETLRDAGLNPIRMKIETTPTSPLARSAEGGYFESHIGVKIVTDLQEKIVRQMAADRGMHMSKNPFKNVNGLKTIMITHRGYDCEFEHFNAEVQYMADMLRYDGYLLDKTIIEYCWYDSNLNLDRDWMGNAA